MASFTGPMVTIPTDLLRALVENGQANCTREQFNEGHDIAVDWIVAATEAKRILRSVTAKESSE